MLARERQNKIVEMVNANGSVLVKELSEMFEVTEDSIRKEYQKSSAVCSGGTATKSKRDKAKHK